MTELVPLDDAKALLAGGQGMAVLDAAERALAIVTEQDEARELWLKLRAIDEAARLMRVHEDISLRAGRLHIRAKRRWGELLGPGEPTPPPPGGVTTGNAMDGRERKDRHDARELAFDVDDGVFQDWLAGLRDREAVRIARLMRKQREEDARRRRAEPLPGYYSTTAREGDLRDVLDDLTGEVDAIVTDPPYERAALGEWDALGELAARVLKPDGLLVAMSGTMFLPDVLDRLRAHLRYRWTCAYMVQGSHARAWAAGFAQMWKPVVVFDRPGAKRDPVLVDVFRSDRPDKAALETQIDGWGQSESGMADIVEHMTQPGDLVCDPFMGSGTTLIVCAHGFRHFVGCDVDRDAVALARQRLFKSLGAETGTGA